MSGTTIGIEPVGSYDRNIPYKASGIVRYNLTTGEKVFTNSYITVSEREWVYFSPDGRPAFSSKVNRRLSVR
jgi:hypothetical protein